MHITLVGNPNSGKTTLFNRLTGLSQKVGNYPGITVDKRDGRYFHNNASHIVSDLPGIYSLFPSSADEKIAVSTLLHAAAEQTTTLVVLIDVQSVKKNLVLLGHLRELGLPVVGVLNYRKNTEKAEVTHWLDTVKSQFNIPWVAVNANSGEGLESLKKQLSSGILPTPPNTALISLVKQNLQNPKDCVKEVTKDLRKRLEHVDNVPDFYANNSKSTADNFRNHSFHAKLDKVLMHPIWGYLIFLAGMLLMFQAVFSWAAYPMDWIDTGFAWASESLSAVLPSNFFTDAITQGIVPGLGGVVIFIPQIAFLFLFIALFEESGYMTRVVYLMDRLVKPFGMSGKSVVPLISGYACAIPAIMASRTIKHPRERLITMLVIPFMTCSARLPVYTTLIALLVSSETTVGPFNAQGLTLLGMYFFGAFMSFVTALGANLIMKGRGRSILLMELPKYKLPEAYNIGVTVFEKSKSFVLQAGKIILLVSLALYFLSNIGFTETFQKIEENDTELLAAYSDQEIAKLRLEHSVIGQLGKGIEPAIAPLGYDWKIGISLITSFAAREVFVGTMATIYALEGQEDETHSIIDKMRNDKRPDGKPVYSMAVVMSLLIFYALALQCLSTVAVMVKESGGWKWAIIQLLLASGAAYALAFVTFRIFSM